MDEIYKMKMSIKFIKIISIISLIFLLFLPYFKLNNYNSDNDRTLIDNIKINKKDKDSNDNKIKS